MLLFTCFLHVLATGLMVIYYKSRDESNLRSFSNVGNNNGIIINYLTMLGLGVIFGEVQYITLVNLF